MIAFLEQRWLPVSFAPQQPIPIHQEAFRFITHFATSHLIFLRMLCRSNNSLQDGVVKLEETGRIVKGLKRELTELQPLLEAKASEAEGLLNQVC